MPSLFTMEQAGNISTSFYYNPSFQVGKKKFNPALCTSSNNLFLNSSNPNPTADLSKFVGEMLSMSDDKGILSLISGYF